MTEAAKKLPRERVIVNVQGDEPFIDPDLIDRLIAALPDHHRETAAESWWGFHSAGVLDGKHGRMHRVGNTGKGGCGLRIPAFLTW